MLFKQINKISSPDVSKSITRSTLLSVSKVKSILPLNMSRIWAKNYLVSFVASHYYPIPIVLVSMTRKKNTFTL